MMEVAGVLVTTVSVLDKEDRGMDIQKFTKCIVPEHTESTQHSRGEDRLDLLAFPAPRSPG